MTFQRLTCLFLGIALCAVPSLAQADDEALAAQIVKLLSNSDREFRAAGLDAIRTSAKGTTLTKTFAAELPKLDAEAQAALITTLGTRGDVAARAAVLEQLSGSKEESVRAAALAALGELGDSSDLPVLIKALENTSNAEQQGARTALVRMRAAAVAKIIASESKTAPPQVRGKLIEILSTRRASSEVPAIIAAATDNDGGVRTAAMNALGRIGKPEQLTAMRPAC
jgi:HEAT repeat protein